MMTEPAMPPLPPGEVTARNILLDCTAGNTAEVDCILAHGGWRFIAVVADNYAGDLMRGPEAYKASTEYALRVLYECHDAPHTDTCPGRQP